MRVFRSLLFLAWRLYHLAFEACSVLATIRVDAKRALPSSGIMESQTLDSCNSLAGSTKIARNHATSHLYFSTL